MLMKVEDFEAVGGFDEEFVVAFNDIDLCMKERAAGKKECTFYDSGESGACHCCANV